MSILNLELLINCACATARVLFAQFFSLLSLFGPGIFVHQPEYVDVIVGALHILLTI